MIDINGNAECGQHGGTSLRFLVENNLSHTKTARAFAAHPYCDVNAFNVPFETIPNDIEFLQILVKNPNFKVDQRWSNKKLTAKQKLSGERNVETLTIYCASNI